MPREIRAPSDVEPIKPYHQFQKKIPIEVRCMIWRYTLPEEQLHELVLENTGRSMPGTVGFAQKQFRFTTPHPVALYVNQESRNEARRFFTLSIGPREVFLPVGYNYNQTEITLDTPQVKDHIWTDYNYDIRDPDITYRQFGIAIKQPKRTWVNYESDVFYINLYTYFHTDSMCCRLTDVANALAPEVTSQIQHLAVDVELLHEYGQYGPALRLKNMIHLVRWLPNLKTLTLVYYDHDSGIGCIFPDRNCGELVLTDNIDEENRKWGDQNRKAIADKFLSGLRVQPVGWGVKGRNAGRKVIVEAEKQKLQNQIDEAKLKDPDLNIPEIRWKYAMRKGMFNLGHFDGLAQMIEFVRNAW